MPNSRGKPQPSNSTNRHSAIDTWQLSLLLPSTLITCWLGMMLLHESGHILAALLSGGSIQHLTFSPFVFSRTDIDPNPHPLAVAWSGPLFGALAPASLQLLLTALKRRSWLLDIFTAFCLLANGAYLAFGSLYPIGDAADLLHLHTPLYTLWLFGLPTITTSLYLLHLQGPRLGITSKTRPLDTILATIAATLLVTLSLFTNH